MRQDREESKASQQCREEQKAGSEAAKTPAPRQQFPRPETKLSSSIPPQAIHAPSAAHEPSRPPMYFALSDTRFPYSALPPVYSPVLSPLVTPAPNGGSGQSYQGGYYFLAPRPLLLVPAAAPFGYCHVPVQALGQGPGVGPGPGQPVLAAIPAAERAPEENAQGPPKLLEAPEPAVQSTPKAITDLDRCPDARSGSVPDREEPRLTSLEKAKAESEDEKAEKKGGCAGKTQESLDPAINTSKRSVEESKESSKLPVQESRPSPPVQGASKVQPNPESQPPEKEESLESLPMSESCSKKFRGNSYKYRNVYKSVVRNMYTYVKNNRSEITRILGKAGYDRAAMEHAFLKISDYNDREHKRGGNKMAQEVIKKVLSKRNIYAYILREATNAMLQNSKSGRFGRVASKNTVTYSVVIETIYKESVTVLGGQEAEGTTFLLQLITAHYKIKLWFYVLSQIQGIAIETCVPMQSYLALSAVLTLSLSFMKDLVEKWKKGNEKGLACITRLCL